MKESTFACKLTAPELQMRKASIIKKLKDIILSKQELAFGYKYIFLNSDEVLELIFDFVKSERQCCPFFDFDISIGIIPSYTPIRTKLPIVAKIF